MSESALEVSAGQARGHKMQFHSWKSGAAVGPELLMPTWLSWDPAVTACALAYQESVVLCRAQPSFAPFITLPLQVAKLCEDLQIPWSFLLSGTLPPTMLSHSLRLLRWKLT